MEGLEGWSFAGTSLAEGGCRRALGNGEGTPPAGGASLGVGEADAPSVVVLTRSVAEVLLSCANSPRQRCSLCRPRGWTARIPGA